MRAATSRGIWSIPESFMVMLSRLGRAKEQGQQQGTEATLVTLVDLQERWRPKLVGTVGVLVLIGPGSEKEQVTGRTELAPGRLSARSRGKPRERDYVSNTRGGALSAGTDSTAVFSRRCHTTKS